MASAVFRDNKKVENLGALHNLNATKCTWGSESKLSSAERGQPQTWNLCVLKLFLHTRHKRFFNIDCIVAGKATSVDPHGWTSKLLLELLALSLSLSHTHTHAHAHSCEVHLMKIFQKCLSCSRLHRHTNYCRQTKFWQKINQLLTAVDRALHLSR